MPGHMEYLITMGSTPSQRFWSVPALCASSARTTALVPLLKQVYPEGLGPLADKLDQLIDRTKGAAASVGTKLDYAPFKSRPRASLRVDEVKASEQRASGGYDACSSSSESGETNRPGTAEFAWDAKKWYADFVAVAAPRPTTAPNAGALISAGLVWERGGEVSRAPALRQCLTYEEIARLRAEEAKPAHER